MDSLFKNANLYARYGAEAPWLRRAMTLATLNTVGMTLFALSPDPNHFESPELDFRAAVVATMHWPHPLQFVRARHAVPPESPSPPRPNDFLRHLPGPKEA